MKRFLQNAVILVITLVILAGLTEVGVRRFRPQALPPVLPGLWVPSPTLGGTYAPGFRGVFQREEFKTPIEINSRGLRDKEYGPKERGTFRILGLGDSFASAMEVPLEESYLKVLEKMLKGKAPSSKPEVINAGIRGYGTLQELRLLQETGFDYEPDLVLVAFFPGNDVYDNVIFAAVEDDRRREQSKGSDERSAGQETTNISGFIRLPPELRVFLRAESYAYNYFGGRWYDLMRNIGVSSISPNVFKEVYSPKEEEGWALTEKILLEMRDLTASRRSKLAIVLIPVKEQIYDEGRALSNLLRRDYDATKPNRIMAEFGAKNGIPILDLLPRFKEVSGSDRLYWHSDIHLNARGHRLAAEEIYRFLLEKGLL